MRSNMKEDIELCHQIQDNCTYKALGISGRSPLVDFPTLYWPQSFPVDVMHLILEGIVPRTFNIWVEAGKQKKKTAESEPLEFGCSAKPPVDDLAGLGADIKNCAPEVPAALAGCPEDVYVHHRSYRAQNWFDFLQLLSIHSVLEGRQWKLGQVWLCWPVYTPSRHSRKSATRTFDGWPEQSATSWNLMNIYTQIQRFAHQTFTESCILLTVSEAVVQLGVTGNLRWRRHAGTWLVDYEGRS
ncbi:hypothetical protein V1521DRAFT_133341 [Lipomyces starkeyi]